mmetsp:Transcript_58393/g.117264  ORF Transcript_58393/g.117264 Transcript_58393/m.117264 type:complete len:88 (-) Transcript_58393:212-475(-)
MGAGASIDNLQDLQREYAMVKKSLSSEGIEELDRTFQDLMNRNQGEGYVIGICREKFNEIQMREIYARQTRKQVWSQIRNVEEEKSM